MTSLADAFLAAIKDMFLIVQKELIIFFLDWGGGHASMPPPDVYTAACQLNWLAYRISWLAAASCLLGSGAQCENVASFDQSHQGRV